MIHAKKHNNPAAINDYTAVIDEADSPSNIRAMALYNRALVYAAEGQEKPATSDLARVLEMEGADEPVKTEARRKLLRMARPQRSNSQSANATQQSSFPKINET